MATEITSLRAVTSIIWAEGTEISSPINRTAVQDQNLVLERNIFTLKPIRVEKSGCLKQVIINKRRKIHGLFIGIIWNDFILRQELALTAHI